MHLRIDLSDDDDYITNLIKLARQYCEQYQNKYYITQTIELAMDDWTASDEIELYRTPVQSITSIKYYDTSDTEYTYSSDNYYFDDYSFVPKIVLKYNTYFPDTTLRTNNAVIIRFVAGFGDASTDVPLTVIQAMYLLIGHWYENREATAIKVSKEIDFAVKSLLDIDKKVNV